MPTKKLNDPLQDQELLAAENRDLEDELEEDVGAAPQKVTMKEYREAELAFEALVSQEKVQIEKTPFRPGKNTVFVLTDNQKNALQDCVDSLDSYFRRETRSAYNQRWYEPANEDLEKLHNAMKKILVKGLNGLSAEERDAVNAFNQTMNAESRDNGRTLFGHLQNVSGPRDYKIADIRAGLDMLGTMIGVPASYEGSKAADLQKARIRRRVERLNRIDLDRPGERMALADAAKRAGIEALEKKFGQSAIAQNLGIINGIANNLGSGTNLSTYYYEDHMRAADGLGAFLTAKNANGKSNYDAIVDVILAGDPANGKLTKEEREAALEQKKAFDELLGHFNTVCELGIGVPYAIEAQQEYNWNREQQKNVNAERIKDLNGKLFGKEATVHAYDDQFLGSIKTLMERIRETLPALNLRSENYTQLRDACLGFQYIRDKVMNSNGLTELSTDNTFYIAVLDFDEILKREQNGKTLYALLEESYEKKGPGKDALEQTLGQLNEKLGLGVKIPGAKLAGEKEAPAPVRQYEPYTRKIAELQRASNRMEDPQKLKQTLAVVLALRRMSVDPAHRDHKKIRTKAASAKAKTLMETKAFKALTDKMSVVELAKKIHYPGNFDKAFAKSYDELDLADYKQRLENENFRKKLAARAAASAGELKRTGTGVNLIGMKRSCNSGMYDRAVLAMERAAKKPDAATVMRSVLVVKEYLSNKMKRRASPSGKTRWESCMGFLHDAMPEEEFKEYCKEINAVRKAKEGSSDYVEPDSFALRKERSKSMSEAAGKKPTAENNSPEAEPEMKTERQSEGPGLGRSSF